MMYRAVVTGPLSPDPLYWGARFRTRLWTSGSEPLRRTSTGRRATSAWWWRSWRRPWAASRPSTRWCLCWTAWWRSWVPSRGRLVLTPTCYMCTHSLLHVFSQSATCVLTVCYMCSHSLLHCVLTVCYVYSQSSTCVLTVCYMCTHSLLHVYSQSDKCVLTVW